MIKQIRTLSLIIGVTVTMPILTIGGFGMNVSVFSFLFSVWFIIVVGLSIRSINKISINLELVLFTSFFLVSLISSLIGLNFFSEKNDWTDVILRYAIKVIIYLVLLWCIVQITSSTDLMNYFMKGFLIGCIINLSWTILEGLFFYISDTTVNDILFHSYLNRLPDDRQYMTIVTNGIIRASGFNTDPAHLGGLIPIVVLYGIYTKNFYLVILALFSLIFSGSSTAAITTALAFIISPWSKIVAQINFNKIGKIFIIVLAVCIIMLSSETVRHGLYNNAEGFYNRTFETYVEAEDKGPRFIYHAYLLNAIKYSGLLVLSGTGFGTASYPYVDNPQISSFLEEGNVPYDPESTYISYLFDTGIFGLLLYCLTLILLISKYRKKFAVGKEYILIHSTLSAILFAGFFYHYTLTAYQVIIICYAIALSCKITMHSKLGKNE